MLYVEDLTLLAIAPRALQAMDNRLARQVASLCTLQTPYHQQCKVRGCPLRLKAWCRGAHFL